MDKRKIEILKLIDKANNSNIMEDYESLKRQGFESGLLKAMVNEGVIGDSYHFYLKEKGENVLRDYLLIEALNTKKRTKIKIIFDSNIYDEIATGNLNINTIDEEKFEFHITHVQLDEINNCSENDKRAKLSLVSAELRPKLISTESLVFDVSRIEMAKLGDGKMLNNLKKGNKRHTKDALIGETAIKNDLLLVTNDRMMKKRVNENGGKAIDLEEFKEMLKND